VSGKKNSRFRPTPSPLRLGLRLLSVARLAYGLQVRIIIRPAFGQRYIVVAHSSKRAMKRNDHLGASAQMNLTKETVTLKYSLTRSGPWPTAPP
jgi:hypothetical protein